MTITLTREEAQQVLDDLENNAWIAPIGSTLSNFGLTLRARLAQPEPKDDGRCQSCEENHCTAKTGCVALSNPPQRVYCSCGDGIVADDGALCGTCVSLKKMREWQGLTDEEIMSLLPGAVRLPPGWSETVRAIEAKLKEKNT